MNGVSLGGWLVLEVFLAPDMFKNASTVMPYRSPRIPAGYNAQKCDPARGLHSLLSEASAICKTLLCRFCHHALTAVNDRVVCPACLRINDPSERLGSVPAPIQCGYAAMMATARASPSSL